MAAAGGATSEQWEVAVDDSGEALQHLVDKREMSAIKGASRGSCHLGSNI